MSIQNLGVERLRDHFAGGEQAMAIRHLASDMSSAMATLKPSERFGNSLLEANEWLLESIEAAEKPEFTEAMLCLSGITSAFGRKVYQNLDFQAVEAGLHQSLGIEIGEALADLDVLSSWRIVSEADEASRVTHQPVSSSQTIGRRVVSNFQHSLRYSAAEGCDALTNEVTAGHTKTVEPEELTMAVELALLADILYPHQVAWNVFPPEEGIKLRWAPTTITEPDHKAVLAALVQMEAADNPTVTTNMSEIDELVSGPVGPGVVAIKPQGIKEVREHYRKVA